MKKFAAFAYLLILVLTVAACSGGGSSQGTPVSGVGGTEVMPLATGTVIVPNATVLPTSTLEAPIPTIPAAPTAGTAVAGTSVPATGGDHNGLYQLCSWTGYNVIDTQGNDLGDTNDFILSTQNAQIQYLIVGAGGFLGIGEKNLLVPWNQFKIDTSKDDKTLVFQGKSDMLKNSPEIDKDNIDFTVANWNANFESYWAGNGTAVVSPTNIASTAVPVNRPVIQNANFVFVSDLCGAWVVDKATYGQNTSTANPTAFVPTTAPVGGTPSVNATADNNLGSNEITSDQTDGEVQTVLIDPNAGKITYLVIDTKDKHDLSGKWVPVPVSSAKIIYNNTTPDKANDLLVLVPIQQLTKAPNFDKDNLPDLSKPDWDAKLRTFWGNIQ